MSKKTKTPKTGGFPWYPFWQGDYIEATTHLSMIEDGAYIRLLNTYYAKERLPSSRRRLYAICRATSRIERRAVDFIVETYFTVQGDRLFHKRAETVIADRRHFYAEQTRKAKLGGQARWKGSKQDKYPESWDQGHARGYAPGMPVGMPVGVPGRMPERCPDDAQPQPQGCGQDLTATGAALTAAPEHQSEEDRDAEIRQDIPCLLAEVAAGILTPKEARDNIISRGAPERFAFDVFPDKVGQAG